eukprot:Tbor_TRINITY_DN6198_c1_g2::TRINITY_DN6198_c1_g2_i2::g.21953::m.21953
MMSASTPPAHRYRCKHCTFSCELASQLQYHHTHNHPESEHATGKFPCMHCSKMWDSNRSRSRHLVACAERARTIDNQQGNVEDPLQIDPDLEETITHLLKCAALQESRDKHKTDSYLSAYGSQYFHSIKFLRWVHSLFQGSQATEGDCQEEKVLPTKEQSYDEEEEENNEEEIREWYDKDEEEGYYEVVEYKGAFYEEVSDRAH